MSASDPDWLKVAPAGFLTFRDDGTVTAVNDFLLRLLGRSRDEVVGDHVEKLLGVAGRIFFQTHLYPLVRMHGHAEEIFVELRAAGGDRVPVLMNLRREEAQGSALTHCVLIQVRERSKYEDELLRARKAAEAATREARDANEAKSLYLRSVSHEIRNPINALLGYADLLELGAGQPMGDRQMEYVERVRKVARHLLTLVNDLLDLAKIESGAMSVDAKESAIGTAAGAALAMVEPQAAAQGIDLLRSGDDSLRYLGDHDRVIQILLNLLSNAVKFTASGGRVELAWDRVEGPVDGGTTVGEGPRIRMWVTDTGAGIAPESLERVFEPFSQIEQTETGKGTGLGLTISRQLARLMGGDLTVRSTPGEGSTFTLWLPGVPD